MAANDKLGPGEPIRRVHHEAWNNAMAAGEQYAASRFDQTAGDRSLPRKTDIIKIKNVSGAARSRGEVLGTFGKSVTNLTPGNIHLTGDAPTAGKHFGILLKPVPNNETTELQLAGSCIATVDVTDETHEYADIEDGEHTLVSSESGPVSLIWKPEGTGELECFVRIGGGATVSQRFWRYTLNEDFGATTSGEAAADLLAMDGTDTEIDVTILDPLGMFDDQVSGDPGFCVQDGESYYALQAPCAGAE